MTATESYTTSTSPRVCGACGGTGYQRNMQTGITERCPVCGGSGQIFDQYPAITC